MKSVSLSDSAVWQRLLLTLQILCLLITLCGLYFLFPALAFFDRPTPTCPEGVETYTSPNDLCRCSQERVELYAPWWAPPLTRIGVGAGSLLLLGGIATHFISKRRNKGAKTIRAFRYQLAVSLSPLILLWVSCPPCVIALVRYVILGAACSDGLSRWRPLS